MVGKRNSWNSVLALHISSKTAWNSLGLPRVETVKKSKSGMLLLKAPPVFDFYNTNTHMKTAQFPG
jgi:hypothetical protein